MAMKYGSIPTEAAQLALKMIVNHYEDFSGAVIAVNKYGHHGAACYGFDRFPYSVANFTYDKVTTLHVTCTKSKP